MNANCPVASFGNNLIFLISQPRAGSTMLQRALGGHPEIHTLSEPWLLLHPLFGLREKGIKVDYDALNIRLLAVNKFLGGLSKDVSPDELYFQGVRRMYGPLYQQALNVSGKRYFLDKTPRYYHIIPELYRTFPHAKFIILFRNPLAVLNSMLKSWANNDWFWLSEIARRHDLLSAPNLLLEGIDILDGNCIIVRYEDFIKNPRDQIKIIDDYLEIAFLPDVVENIGEGLQRWFLGDQGNVYEYQKPVPAIASTWIEQIEVSQYWRFMQDYLHMLGKDIVEKMGYSYRELESILFQKRPARIKTFFTLPLYFYLKSYEERAFIERNFIRLLKLFSKS